MIDSLIMLAAFICLAVLLAITRKQDTFCWWVFRLLVTYSLICFVYLSLGYNHLHNPIFIRFIRCGDLALALALLLYSYLLRVKPPEKTASFNQQLASLFNHSKNTG